MAVQCWAVVLLRVVLSALTARAVLLPYPGVAPTVPKDGSGWMFNLSTSPWVSAGPALGYQPGAQGQAISASAAGNDTGVMVAAARGSFASGGSTRTVFIYAALMKNGVVLGWANGYPEWGQYITAVYYKEGRTSTINGRCGIHGCENAFCAAHVSTHQDKLLVFGGHNDYTYMDSFRMWDNKRHVLTLAGSAWPFRLASRRWYPSAVTLPNGLVLLMGGVTHSGRAEYGYDRQYNNPTYCTYNPNTRRFSRDKSDAAAQLSATFPINTYPHLIVLPDGGLVVSAGSTLVKYRLIGGDTLRKVFSYPNRPHPPWSYPQTGIGIMLPIAPPWKRVEFLAAGGTSKDRATQTTPASDKAHVIMLTSGRAATWRSVGPMPYRRVMGDGLVLCDGTVGFFNGAQRGFAGWHADRLRRTYDFGGGRGKYQCRPGFCSRASGFIYEPVIYTPCGQNGLLATADCRGVWSRKGSLAQMRGRPRMYHSNAVLLPSCKVMLAGSDVTGGTDAELWSPPYLSLPRPTMGPVPASLKPGATFSVTYSSSTPVNRALLQRTATHTHSLGFDARALWLQVVSNIPTSRGGTLRLRLPSSSTQIPPGMYMLTILTARGGPSNGAIMSVCPTC
ncbi:Aldehyde oxidase GLOX1 [Chlorella vulgaris]